MYLGHISWMFGWSADVLMSHPWIHSGYRTSQWYSLRVGLANWQGRSMFGWMCGLAQVLSVWMQHLILLHIICCTYSAGNVFSSSVCWGLTFDRISYGDIQDCLWCFFFVTVAVFALISEGDSCNLFRGIICREKNWIYIMFLLPWSGNHLESVALFTDNTLVTSNALITSIHLKITNVKRSFTLTCGRGPKCSS